LRPRALRPQLKRDPLGSAILSGVHSVTIYPPPQEQGWLSKQILRGLVALTRFPRWVIPPVVGAVLLFAMTALRGVFLLFSHPGRQALFAFLLALVVATAAGALAGGVFVLIRIPFRYLGAIGDLLTGIILGWVYLFAILVPAKYLFGDDTLQTSSDWVFAAAYSGGFGVVVVILYWYNAWRMKKGQGMQP